MSLKVSQSNDTEFEQVPEGVYTVRCYRIIDLGTQTGTWMGNEKFQKKIVISWEVLDDEVKMLDKRPFAITKTYTASLYENGHLFQDLSAWRGKSFTEDELQEFDIKNVIGAYATMQIVHKLSADGKKKYANFNSIMQFKGVKPDPVNDNLVLSLDQDEFDQKIFDGLSEYYQTKIQAAPEYPGNQAKIREELKQKDVVIEDMDEAQKIDLDEIPF